MSEEYFAAKPTSELLGELSRKVEAWNRYADRKGFRKKWEKLYQSYYGKQLGEGSSGSASQISRAGDEGEFTTYATNHFRNLIKHQLALTCSQKPAFDPKAKNSDLKSLQQARLAPNIIDSYLTEKRISRYLKSAAERALAFNKGYVILRWEPSAGRPYGTQPVVGDDGQPKLKDDGTPHEKIVYEGDVDCEAISPWNVIYDIHLDDWNKRDWDIARFRRNKYNLAAKYPKFKDQILSLSASDELNELGVWRELEDISEDTDMISFYEFYHKRNDALPNGRYAIFLNREVCLYDGPIPYEKLNIFRITPGEVFDTPEGYSEANDILVLQDVLNVLSSSAFTNLQAFAVQSIWLPEGCDLSASQIGKGLSVLKGGAPGTEPKAIQLAQSPPELYKFRDMVQKDMEFLTAINASVRGDPESNLKSGLAIGKVQQMAVQFNSNFQESWAELQEDAVTFLLDLLRQFAKTERMTALAGKHNRGAMKSFTGADLEGVSRVEIDLGNPMSRTISGRIEMADQLLQKGLIKTPQEYIGLIATGQLDPLTEGPQAEIDLVRKENETLMDGGQVKAIVGDPHLLHIQEHRTVIADSSLRSLADAGDPEASQVVQNVLNHIQEHKNIYQSQDPIWSAVSGEPPAPPMPPPMMGPPGAAPQGPPGPPPMPMPMMHGPPPHGPPPPNHQQHANQNHGPPMHGPGPAQIMAPPQPKPPMPPMAG